MIWYKFHYGDYLTHTAHLADAEDLAYRRLLDYYYMSEKPLPLDTKTVARHIRIDLDITEVVLSEFFEQTPEGWKNTRCDNEIERYNNQCVKNQNVGKRGGRPKLETDSVNDSDTNTNPIQIQKQIQKQKNHTSNKFDLFWQTWPTSKRKVAKNACLAKWEKHGLDALSDAILENVAFLKTSEQWLTGWEPSPLTYINQRRWEDVTLAPVGRRVI